MEALSNPPPPEFPPINVNVTAPAPAAPVIPPQQEKPQGFLSSAMGGFMQMAPWMLMSGGGGGQTQEDKLRRTVYT